MKTIGNNIVVTRGEVFVLARDIVYNNGAPYVLRSQLENPYLLITISSNTYRLAGRYFKRYWLDLSEYPKFDTTEVKDITLQQLTNHELPEGYSASTCIYRYLSAEGESTYYRYVGQSPDGTYEEYSFSFIQTFLNSDTREWIESIYRYDIRIVSGETTQNYLTETYQTLFPDTPIPGTIEEMYKDICKVKPELLEYVCLSAPIVNYTTNDIVLSPSKLIVDANA